MDLDAIFGALASVPRRQILAFLSQTALSTTDLAERFSLSPPAVSRHLALLERAGLVVRGRQGQRVLYRLQREALLAALARFASEVDGPLRREPLAPRTPREAL
jgi:ArsR family transcriptional regulator